MQMQQNMPRPDAQSLHAILAGKESHVVTSLSWTTAKYTALKKKKKRKKEEKKKNAHARRNRP
jgi:hypothetical protein